jgi:hypothetical protein
MAAMVGVVSRAWPTFRSAATGEPVPGAELVQHLVAEQDHRGEIDIDGIPGRLLRAKNAVATGRAADGSPSARARARPPRALGRCRGVRSSATTSISSLVSSR